MFGSKIRSWEKERRRSTWEREKREGKGAPERQRKRKWETNGFWEFQVKEAREKWRGLIYFQGQDCLWDVAFWIDVSYLLGKEYQIWGLVGIPKHYILSPKATVTKTVFWIVQSLHCFAAKEKEAAKDFRRLLLFLFIYFNIYRAELIQ